MPAYDVDQIVAAAPRMKETSLMLLDKLLNKEKNLYSQEDWKTIRYVMMLSKNDIRIKMKH